MKAGVLALQGAFREHREVLDALGVDAVEVRVPQQLSGLDALFMPGGESTTITKLLETSGLREPLRAEVAEGLPVFGTCAGLILLARDVRDADNTAYSSALDALDCTVTRNAYGRQRESFETRLAIDGIDDGFPGVFIRAPVIGRVGDAVEVLAEHGGNPVLVRERSTWGATFHPELSGDLRLHQLFLAEVAVAAASPTATRGGGGFADRWSRRPSLRGRPGESEPELATAPKENP